MTYNSSVIPFWLKPRTSQQRSTPSPPNSPLFVSNKTIHSIFQCPFHHSHSLDLHFLREFTLQLLGVYTVEFFNSTKSSVSHYHHQQWADSTYLAFVFTLAYGMDLGLPPITWTWFSFMIPNTSLELPTTFCHVETLNTSKMGIQHRYAMWCTWLVWEYTCLICPDDDFGQCFASSV